MIEPWATKRGSRHGMSSYKPLAYRTSVTANLEQRSHVPFRIDRIIIPANVASSFQIDRIVINGRDQLAGRSPLPAVLFLPTAMDSFIQMDALYPEGSIVIRVTYTGDDDEGRMFIAALIGTTFSMARGMQTFTSSRSTLSVASSVMMGARRAQLTATITKRGRGWSAYCEGLGAVAEGRSCEAAKAHLASRIEEMMQRPFALRDDARAPSSFHVTLTDLTPSRVLIESNDPITLAARVARFQRFAHSRRDALVWPALGYAPAP